MVMAATAGGPGSAGAVDGTLTIATWNLNNYIIQTTESRKAKLEPSRQKIVATLLSIKADVVAFQEVGDEDALGELRGRLKTGGLDYPFWEMVSGSDTNIHVAVISRFPIVNRVSHTSNYFLLMGKRFRVSRGFAEVSIQVSPEYRFDMLVAHLKSKLSVPYADQEQLRQKEAEALRKIVSEKMASEHPLNLVVVGDFNDTRGSRAIGAIRGRGKTALWDVRPTEATGGVDTTGREVAWTYHYAAEDSYDRIDYVFLSADMKRELVREQSYVYSEPGWWVASDHRPLVVEFLATDQ